MRLCTWFQRLSSHRLRWCVGALSSDVRLHCENSTACSADTQAPVFASCPSNQVVKVAPFAVPDTTNFYEQSLLQESTVSWLAPVVIVSSSCSVRFALTSRVSTGQCRLRAAHCDNRDQLSTWRRVSRWHNRRQLHRSGKSFSSVCSYVRFCNSSICEFAATDAAGLVAWCAFNVTVQLDETACPLPTILPFPPSVHTGRRMCTLGTNSSFVLLLQAILSAPAITSACACIFLRTFASLAA